MLGRRSIWLLAALVALVWTVPGRGAEELPTGRAVISRGRATLSDALLSALACVLSPGNRTDATPPTITLIVDTTPYVAQSEDALLAALLVAGERLGGRARWRVARLGEEAGPARTDPSLLAPEVVEVLARDARTDDTFTALRRTINAVPDDPAVFVYLAHWHFEDDRDVEGLVDLLTERGATLSVIGPEAAFGQAWNDGFFPPDRLSAANPTPYDPRVGRNPFAESSEGPPWHGGDSAYPHLPGRWFHGRWSTRFTVHRPAPLPPGTRADPGALAPDAERGSVSVSVVLPSGFGPWGLMRVAHESGGRYVLHGWTADPGLGVRYDYGRLDSLAPDLRSRAEILAGLRRRPLARAMLRAWRGLANAEVHVANTTAPVAEGGRRGAALREVRGHGFLSYSWHEPRGHTEFLARAGRARAALAAALRTLGSAIGRAPEIPDDVDRRLLADARLMRHVVRVHRFEIGEALAAARRRPGDAWRDASRKPGLRADLWIRAEGDPDRQRLDPVELHDEQAGAEILRERIDLLRRYAGTPHAEQIARNSVETYHFHLHPYGKGDPGARRGPDESNPERPPVTGGSEGASGPATGK